MNTFKFLLDGMSEFDTLCSHVKKGRGYFHALGISSSQKNHLIYALAEKTSSPCVVITSDELEAVKTARELSFFCGSEAVYFPPREYLYYDVDVSDRKSEIHRLSVLPKIKDADYIVTTISALASYTLPERIFRENTIKIDMSSVVDMDDFISKLTYMGYAKVSAVENVGQFSVRGSIIDVFSPSHENPVRIELWGDDIDSMREFSWKTQLSLDAIEETHIYPARELVYTREEAQSVAEKIRSLKNENLLRDAEKLRENHYFYSNDKYLRYFYDTIPTLFDYLPEDTFYVLCEPKELKAKFDMWYKEQNEVIVSLMDKGLFPRGSKDYFITYTDIALHTSKSVAISVSTLSHATPEIKPKEIVSFASRTIRSYTENAQYMVEDIVFWKESSFRVVVLLSTDIKIRNLTELLLEKNINAVYVENFDKVPDFGEVFIAKGTLDRGFEYPSIKTVLVTDGESTQQKKTKPKPKNSKDALKSFDEIKEGDYVVHRTHGVGKYVGIHQLEVQGVIRDYLKIKYKGTDTLYVPVEQLDLLYKYSSVEEKQVKLNSLGGTMWQKTVTKVKESVALLAEDMIKLYAERSRIKGHTFPKDTDWQRQFEGDFLYEETPDQLRCIEEVKRDMEEGKCMDRLLCGDVGYGKTEVALRTAFKTVMDGFQVAYLVPTTILASQHYTTFLSRMKEYCINVEMLSRFRSKKQQEEILKKLETGEIDVVIGTHRILQKDVKFKSLGLLIVDEEQRFGVKHKETLKEIKKDVNVLTLSATPIPRTLNMAMMGIRDLSVLSSPPNNRAPVQSFVMEYNPIVVENAIRRELARGGQVYYLYNRVDSIYKTASMLSELVPEARVGVAHGKMSESELEKIMLDLIDGHIDVLVCTTIIETGLDVPNVNTLIVENSDHLGLSQLYQLKGRVGRSNRLSFAYFTYHEGKVLEKIAQKRLNAIREFTEFGSGFKIALRDLEIRGAGNILGKEQHGNMNLVGYDMYCLLLERAVKELKGESAEETASAAIDLKVSAFIPEKSVPDEKQRMEMYRQIATISSEEDVREYEAQYIDRYGDIPESVTSLMEIALIKSIASELFITDITRTDSLVVFSFSREPSPKAIVDIMSEYRGKMMFSSGEVSYMSYECEENILNNVKIILQRLKSTIQDETK